MSLFYVFGICYIYTFHTYIFILVLSRTFIFYLSSTLCIRILSLLFMCFHIFSYDIHILCFSDAFHILYFSYDFHILCFSYAFLFYTLYCSYTFHVLSSCTLLLVLVTVYTFIDSSAMLHISCHFLFGFMSANTLEADTGNYVYPKVLSLYKAVVSIC